MKEIFKDIPKYEGYYQISNLGRVKSLPRLRKANTGEYLSKERILKNVLQNNGYLSVGLSKKGKVKTLFIHQLMGITFLNHKPNRKKVIDHINETKIDNRLDNLQVISQRHNTLKNRSKFRIGKSKYVGVFWRKSNSKWFSTITINKKRVYLGSFNEEYDAHLAYQKALTEIESI